MAGICAFVAVPAANKVSHLLLEMRPDNGMALKNTASKRMASKRLCLLVTRACTPSRTPTSRPHTHHKSHTCTYPTPRLVPPVSLAASHLVVACFVPLAVCRASSTETGPACSGAASGNAVAEPHQLPVADRHERCETESGGWRRQDAARVRAAAGTGAREKGARGEFGGARDVVFDVQRQVLLVVFVLCVLCMCVCVCTCVSLARLGIFAAGRAVVEKTYIVVFMWERPDGVILLFPYCSSFFFLSMCVGVGVSRRRFSQPVGANPTRRQREVVRQMCCESGGTVERCVWSGSATDAAAAARVRTELCPPLATRTSADLMVPATSSPGS